MESELIMNRLPLPRYFDGQKWETVFKPTRKSIPSYLHEDLPSLKHIYLKQKFKQMGKFNCPDLDYFSKMIKKRPNQQEKQKKAKNKDKDNQGPTYEEIKEELQYALLTSDRQSNIMDNLVSKAQKVSKNQHKSQVKSSRKHNSFSQPKKHRYFDATVDLIFKNRKLAYLNQSHKGHSVETSDDTDNYVNNIKLLQFQSYG